jgi:hypothetical protein
LLVAERSQDYAFEASYANRLPVFKPWLRQPDLAF